MKKYTREDLLKICEQAFVPESKWHDRDSENAQCKLGECYALLKAGCDFEVTYKDEDSMCVTDENTIWLYVYSKGFFWFEFYGEDRDDYKEKHHYYLPTQKRLDETKDEDWY